MIPRLYFPGPLASGALVGLLPEQVHYLRNVLRREAGATVSLFNARDGEFASELTEVGKKAISARVGPRTAEPRAEPDLVLYFALIKRAPTEMILQKATELGVAAFQPITTRRTNADRFNEERARAIVMEAAEQSGRMSVPIVHAPGKLADVLANWDQERDMVFCDEAGDDPAQEWGGIKGRAMPMIEALAMGERADDGPDEQRFGRPAGILIGPEGGFTPEERAEIRGHGRSVAVTLGPRILRADTAAIAALALWQATQGDWRGG